MPAPGLILLAGLPLAVLAGLMLLGALAPLPGLAALLVCAFGIVALLRAARERRGLLAAALQLAGAPAPAPNLPGLIAAIEHLGRRLREHDALLVRMRQADAAIIEALPDPLLVLDAHGAPLRANAAARQLFGGAGEDLPALLRHPALAGAVEQAQAGQGAQAADLVLPVPVARELAARVIPLQPTGPDPARLLVVLADRTRERAVERMRADFVANASHELRTPLASLIGFIETLRGPAEEDAAARARFLGIMAEQSERMRRLIDDLLSLSRIELNEHQAPAGRAELVAIIQAEAAALEPQLRAKEASLALELPEQAEAAPADAEQLAQVVRNLLENAIRYGRQGGQVRLRLAPAEGGRWPARPGLVLCVADDGPGIPKQHIPRLTERFYRVNKARGPGGTGLGLAIVKHIVNRHRGRLVIESEEGNGSRFSVWLPAGPAEPLATA